MEVYLLRHGIAENAGPGMPDADRALTGEGKDKLRRVLKQAGIEPSLILSSPYKRAIETAEVAADVLGYEGKVVQVRALLPEGTPQGVWEELRSRKTEPSIVLAGHEPLMSALAAYLLNTPALQVDMKKAALMRIDFDRVGAEPRGILKWMLTPAVAS
jgi:phosphohistidine phosphatase